MSFRVLLGPSLVTSCLMFILCTECAARQKKESQDPPSTILVNVNRVLVPVVVLDKQGHAVDELKKEDFQVFDSGKPQVTSGFTVKKREVTESAPGSGAENTAKVSTPNAPPRCRSYRSESPCTFSMTSI